jgi:hypothetical protein
VIGLGVVALIGGGFGVAWSLGAFSKGDRVATGDSGGDETGVVAAESGPLTPDLPSTGETGASVGETGGAEAGTDSGASAEGGDASTGGAASTGGGDSGGSSTGGSDSGGSSGGSSGGGDSGGSSGGDSGGGGDDGGEKPHPKDPPFEPTKLVQSGSLYTTKAHAPNGTFASAKRHCAGLKNKKKHGLKGWRMATVAELLSFRTAGVDKLRYWSSESDGRKAKTVSLLNGKIEQLDLGEEAVRAFCVSKR